jgi:hypothetical protein
MFSKESLIKQFGLEGLSEEAQDQQLAQIRQIVQLRVGSNLADQLSEEQLGQFNELTNSGKDAEALDFLANAFPDYQQKIVEELQKLKQETDETTEKMTSSI